LGEANSKAWQISIHVGSAPRILILFLMKSTISYWRMVSLTMEIHSHGLNASVPARVTPVASRQKRKIRPCESETGFLNLGKKCSGRLGVLG
jgi:hypothetical protein